MKSSWNKTQGNTSVSGIVQWFLLALVALFLSGCGIQSIPMAKNEVDAALSEVTNQYQRRADLIPNLVEVVKGYASHEKETLEAVVSARASATSIKLNPGDLSSEKLKEFQARQGELSQALGRLLMVTENYPNLKADQNFRDLSVQLEGTENRITIARQRLIEQIKNFNNQVTVPPTSWTNALFYHHAKMEQWDVAPEEKTKIQTVPKVEFGK